MTGWLDPWALLGLPLAGIPLLLHLFQQRDPPTVEFPAVRYLVQVAEEHQRRLRFRHLLLLLVRTLLLIALVLAAAGPSLPVRHGGSHAPSALVLVLDDSPSAGAVAGGSIRFESLRSAAARILQVATPGDALWLLTSTGVVERGTAADLGERVAELQPGATRMDLGAAITLAANVLATDPRPGGIVVLSDLQASALSPAVSVVPVVVAGPAEPPPTNTGVERIDVGPVPWTPDGGRVVVGIGGDSGPPVPVSIGLGQRPPRQALVAPGEGASFTLGGVGPGWWPVHVTKAADEFRADDGRETLVRIVPPAAVAWDPRDRFLQAACGVLEGSGRLRRGKDLALGALGPGPSVVPPPADPAAVGALNRALERRGVGWRFGAPVTTSTVLDSSALVGREGITRRYTLVPPASGTGSDVLATAGGAPWLVQSGEVVLVGSRFDPAWTTLPLSVGFLPFLDALVNRVARGGFEVIEAASGGTVVLPDRVTEVIERGGPGRRWRVEGGAAFQAPATGLFFLLQGRDTVGGLSVNLDAREGRLAAAPPEAVSVLWSGARVVRLGDVPGAAFAALGHTSLQAPLLWLALLLGVAEVVLASGTGRTAGKRGA